MKLLCCGRLSGMVGWVVVLAVGAVLFVGVARGWADGRGGGGVGGSEALLEMGLAAYERGVELRGRGEEEAARRSFGEASSAFRDLLEAGHGGAGLMRNIGLAEVNAGRLGHGIVWLRRARALSAFDDGIARDLAAARARVTTRVDGGGVVGGGGAVGVVGVLGREWLLWSGVGVAGFGWLMVGLWAAGVRRVGLMSGLLLVAVGWLMAGGALLGMSALRGEVDGAGVVVDGGVVARTGPSEVGYPGAFESALGAGVEVRVLERRGGWWRVALGDGREAWVPSDGLMLVAMEGW